MSASVTTPKVSVIVPAFNAERSIDAALESVFTQTFTDFEVVVVDDGSTDATARHLAEWGDRIRVFRQANAGPAAARNRAIGESRGELIAFLDADDIWLPSKLAMQVDYFAAYPQTGLLHTVAVNQAASDGREAPGTTVGLPPEPPRGVFCDLFHTDLDINTLTVMVPRRVLDDVGLFDERREIHVEDWDLWLRIAARHPVGYLRCATAVRRPGGVMSRAFERTFTGQAAVVEKMWSVCETACPRHAADRDACRRRRWHRLHWELGYARQRVGDRSGARRAFLAALRYRPRHLGTYMHLAGTLVGARLRRLARFVKPSGTVTTPGRGSALPPGMGSAFAVPQSPPPSRGDGDDTPPPRVSLVYDTLYRRARHALAERVHDVDDLLMRRDDRRRILFEAASPMSFVIFKPVYDWLRKDPRLEFWFTATGSWDAAALFGQFGIHDRVVRPRQAEWMKVDACVNTDFWDATWLHRRTRRIHLFHGVAGKYALDAPVDFAPAVAIYDRLLFPNRDRLERYVEAGLVQAGGPAGALVGYPKVDRLVDGSLDVEAVRDGLGFDRRNPTIIYAPTWSPHSSLNLMGEPLVAGLAAAGFNVIVKLHDRSYDLSQRGSGGVDWARRFAAYRSHPGVRLVTDPDATPYLATADALVTDHSSIGFEFALLDRPIVVLDCPELIAHAAITPSKVAQLRAAAEVTTSAAGVVAALARQLENPCLHRAERLALAETFFYRPGTASGRAAAVVYDVLALAAPSPVVAEDPKAVASMAR